MAKCCVLARRQIGEGSEGEGGKREGRKEGKGHRNDDTPPQEILRERDRAEKGRNRKPTLVVTRRSLYLTRTTLIIQ